MDSDDTSQWFRIGCTVGILCIEILYMETLYSVFKRTTKSLYRCRSTCFTQTHWTWIEDVYGMSFLRGCEYLIHLMEVGEVTVDMKLVIIFSVQNMHQKYFSLKIFLFSKDQTNAPFHYTLGLSEGSWKIRISTNLRISLLMLLAFDLITF